MSNEGARRRRVVNKLQEWKAKRACAICYSRADLTFPHIWPELKRGLPRDYARRGQVNRMWTEVAICVLLCRVCHDGEEILKRNQGRIKWEESLII